MVEKLPVLSRGASTFLLVSLTACAPAPRQGRPPGPPIRAAAPPVSTPRPPPEVTDAGPPARAIAEIGARWGTPDPVVLAAASPDRRWIAFCQARVDTNGDGKVSVEIGRQGELRGDRLTGYFADEPGAGVAIDAFAGADPSGRFVAMVRERRLMLRDTTTGVDVSLDASLRDDRAPFLLPRYVGFDPTGQRMLYVARDATREFVKVRHLLTGAESRLDVGDGELYRARFDPTGAFVVLEVIPADTNGNGRLDWAVPEAPAPWMRCSGPVPRFPAWERAPDAVTTRVARADGTQRTDVTGWLTPWGDAFVVRAADQALELLNAEGVRTPLVKKECAARVIHADPGRRILITTCARKKSKDTDLVLVTAEGTRPLSLQSSATGGEHWDSSMQRLVPLYGARETVLFDADESRTEALRPGDRVIASRGARALVLRGRRLFLHELGGTESELADEVEPLGHIVVEGPVVAVPPLVVDVERGASIGTTRARVLAVSTDGAVLTADGRGADADGFAVGPLVWLSPVPSPVPSVPPVDGVAPRHD